MIYFTLWLYIGLHWISSLFFFSWTSSTALIPFQWLEIFDLWHRQDSRACLRALALFCAPSCEYVQLQLAKLRPRSRASQFLRPPSYSLYFCIKRRPKISTILAIASQSFKSNKKNNAAFQFEAIRYATRIQRGVYTLLSCSIMYFYFVWNIAHSGSSLKQKHMFENLNKLEFRFFCQKQNERSIFTWQCPD